MALFGRKKKAAPDKEPRENAPEQERPQRTARSASLTSGRMASLFRQLYRWIFSVNLTAGVYQIESGEDTFAAGPLPIRGYYRELLERLGREMPEEQRERFAALFSAESLRGAMESGRTSLSALFCARELGAEEDEERPRDLKWYELRAEWPLEVNPQNMICVLSVRPVQSDLDSGRERREAVSVPRTADGRIDWDTARAAALDISADSMDFEYDVTEDCFYLHRLRGSSEGDRVTKSFLARFSTSADRMISHESARELERLLRAGEGRGVESGTVLCRKDGVYGAPFRRYRMTTAPLKENGAITWLVGRMEDVEEEMDSRARGSEIAGEISNMLTLARISMFQMNLNQGLIFRVVQDETGFRREEKPQKLADYLQKRIAAGRIAPEAQGEYLKWLENGYLQRKTAQGPYEFEAHLKEMDDVDFRWYMETIVAMKGRPGQFMRWRRDDTEGHMAREVEYENKQLAGLAEYNGRMLDTMANLVEFRNVESGDHIRHVRRLTEILLEDIRKRSPQYELTGRQAAMYVQASTMHDIGKITIPDYILNKEGRLTPEEYEIMKRHTTDGALIIDRLHMPGQEALKSCIRDVVLHHHERYDGNGYPERLAGDEITIGVQAVSLADVYDALVSERCYKSRFAFDEAQRMILDGQCGVFNPCLIESLKACAPMMKELYGQEPEQPDARNR